MKQFKLIKQYPDSGKEVGEIITFEENQTELLLTTTDNYSEFYYRLEECEKYSEFWEKIPERDYEILSFKFIERNSLRIGDISVLGEDGKYHWKGAPDSFSCTLEEMLNSVAKHKKLIHSVKRLSDGVILTLGDLIISTNLTVKIPCEIQSIITTDKTLYITAETPIKNLEERQAMSYTGFGQKLETLELADLPLFITEDGVEMFQGDTYFYTNNSFVTPIEEEVVYNEDFYKRKSQVFRFSSKKAADNYILINKPYLSVNDVMNAGYGLCCAAPLLEIIAKKNGKV